MKFKALGMKSRSFVTIGAGREIARAAEFSDITAMTGHPSPTLQSALAEDARTDRQAVLVAIAIVAAFTVVNSLSGITEYRREGLQINPAYFWIYEMSSLIIHVPILFALSWFTRRFPPAPGAWGKTLLIYAGGAVAYSAVHVFGMVMVRKIVFALIYGEAYHFVSSTRPWLVEAIYEFRKDLLAFAMFVGLFALWRSRAEARREADAARREASETSRLTLKCGGRTIFIDAASIDYAKAAGNYVEITAGAKTHLARITMAALEEQLAGAGAPIVRTHRSWIVNRTRIEEILPAGDGDVTVKLKSGADIPGSRRYRDRLEA
jgi:hypothetical protein